MKIVINDESVIRRLESKGIKQGTPRFNTVFNAACDILKSELVEAVDKCIEWAIKFPNLNRGKLKKGDHVKFQGLLWEVTHVGPSGALIECLSNDNTLIISEKAEVEVFKSPS